MSKPQLSLKERRRQRHDKALREQAQEIINAERRYSAPFRAEVQDALTNWPHKLPMLIVEAERMAERRGTRKTRKPLIRSSCFKSAESYAERAESLFDLQHDEMLDERMDQRAKLLSQILSDISSEAGIGVSHRYLVRAYIVGIEKVGKRHSPFVAAAMLHAKKILDGCSEEQWQHIQDFWSDDPAKYGPAREADRCFSWHCKYFSGATELQRDEHSSTAPINLSELKAERDRLQSQLRFLDHLPETESSRFRIQTELDEVEREIAAAEEWPDEIGGDV